jgi:acetylornithine aminotransferase
MYAKPELAALLGPGKHGCTLGGNALCTAVAKTIFDIIQRDGLTERAAVLGEQTIARLKHESSIRQKIASVRGKGLFLGIELKEAPTQFAEKALAKGLIINLTAKKVIRVAPPINLDVVELISVI